MLNLEYTPSPSLLPVQSQLKVYLNDELMGVLPVTKEQLGKKTLGANAINPLFIPTSTVYGWSLSAIIRTCAKTRPAPRFGWMLGGAVDWI
ncbi:cellulose synthase regulator protein [Escherichia coli]|uniref:Cyclic di-GMP-binding protein n=1 Tax=Escherichia coli TaxID=562 RepID=A0A377AK29_ECOLX|nr:cellulose synthase regulator protein [Escherichia coli]